MGQIPKSSVNRVEGLGGKWVTAVRGRMAGAGTFNYLRESTRKRAPTPTTFWPTINGVFRVSNHYLQEPQRGSDALERKSIWRTLFNRFMEGWKTFSLELNTGWRVRTKGSSGEFGSAKLKQRAGFSHGWLLLSSRMTSLTLLPKVALPPQVLYSISPCIFPSYYLILNEWMNEWPGSLINSHHLH